MARVRRRYAASDIPRPVSTFVGEGYSVRDAQALSYFVRITASNLIGSHLLGDLWAQHGVQRAFNNDFLMHALLMTSASQLQRLNPVSGDEYKIQSTKHLHLSLRSFRNALNSRTYVSNNFEAVLATTFLFLMHSCSSTTFGPVHPDIDGFLQHASGLYDVVRYNPACVPRSHFQPLCKPRLLPAVSADRGPALNLAVMIRMALSRTQDLNTGFYDATVKSLTPILNIVTSESSFGGASPDAFLLYLVH